MGPEYIPKIEGAARPVTRELTCWYIVTLMARSQHPNFFDDVAALPPPARDLVELGSRIPATVRFGVSTWTYDGWTGDVYHRAYRGAQPARRLEEYARYAVPHTLGTQRALRDPPRDDVPGACAP